MKQKIADDLQVHVTHQQTGAKRWMPFEWLKGLIDHRDMWSVRRSLEDQGLYQDDMFLVSTTV